MVTQTFMLNPVNDQLLQVPEYSGLPEKVIWDVEDPKIFVIIEGTVVYVYRYDAESIDGPQIVLIDTDRRPSRYVPIALWNGVVMYQERYYAIHFYLPFVHIN